MIKPINKTIYLEAQSDSKPIVELLRLEGLFSSDLARIRHPVKEGARQRLSAKPGKKQDVVRWRHILDGSCE